MQVGRKKQDEIEHKIDNLYRQNLELITQNKSLLNEVNNKSEYTKTLEHLFMFILEFFMKKNEPSTTANPFTTKTASDCFNHILDKSKELFKDIRDVNPIPNPLGNINNLSNLNNLNNLSGLRSDNIKNLPMLEDANNFTMKKEDEKLGLPQAINSPVLYHQSSPRLSIDHMQGLQGGNLSNYGNLNLTNYQSYHNLSGDFFDHNDLKISRKSSTFSAVPREGYDDYLNSLVNNPFRQDLSSNIKKEYNNAGSSVYSSPSRTFRTRKESFISEEPLKPRSSKTTLIINSDNENHNMENSK